MNTVVKVVLGAVLVLTSTSLPVEAMAQEDEVCVAVYPCDDEGNVIAPYDKADGFCAERFRSQCAGVKAEIAAAKLVSCRSEKESLASGYKKEIRKLRKKLKKAKSQ